MGWPAELGPATTADIRRQVNTRRRVARPRGGRARNGIFSRTLGDAASTPFGEAAFGFSFSEDSDGVGRVVSYLTVNNSPYPGVPGGGHPRMVLGAGGDGFLRSHYVLVHG